MLYPLKFKPRVKERIWGGRKLETVFNKTLPPTVPIGESWDLSGVEGDVSIVANGLLKGNSLSELIEIYMGDLVGESVFERFGQEFPLLIKLIDANDYLSIQVHPDDALAAERHHSFGKTEMWYVVDCQDGASLYLGFNQPVDKAKYLEHLNSGKLEELLNKYTVKPGDTFFIPAGAIHAIGKGILVAEIQQTSDVTYRVYDFNRTDDQGQARELHTELALDAINYREDHSYDVTQQPILNHAVQLQSCPYFASAVTLVKGSVVREYMSLDSFVVYICLEGSLSVECHNGSHETIHKGETLLIPAIVDNVTLKGEGKLLETWISTLG